MTQQTMVNFPITRARFGEIQNQIHRGEALDPATSKTVVNALDVYFREWSEANPEDRPKTSVKL
jgi:hypothetical protein